MNWDTILPWRSEDSEDSSYEDEVIDRCDHDFEQTTQPLPRCDLREAKFEDGLLVIPRYEEVEEFCTKCGEPGLDGEVHPYESKDFEYLTPYDGSWVRVAELAVFTPNFVMDPDLSVSDATTEEAEDDGENRVIVSREESEEEAPAVPHTDFGVTD